VLISGWRGEAASARLLTLGAEPQQFTVLPKQYMRFEINLINDYCAKPTSIARGLCMKTPKARISVSNCHGEAWLLVNPTKAAEPTVNNREFISMHGNSTNFIEVSEFSVVQAVTHIAVFNPAQLYYGATTFQIWAVNTLDTSAGGQVSKIVPLPRVHEDSWKVGSLHPTIVESGSIFKPSEITLTWNFANISNKSGTLLRSSGVEYRLYYIRLGEHTESIATVKRPANILSSACGILMNGKAAGNWTTARTETMKLDIDGGLYVFNVLARESGWKNWFPRVGNYCTSPCLMGAFQPLPYMWSPFKPTAGTASASFSFAMSTLLSAFGILGCIIAGGFYTVYDRAKKRNEAQELQEMQQMRRAAIERGEKYPVVKKRRALTLWERLTGEIITKDDEEYDDCLSPEERRKIELYHRNELGADSEFDTRDIPSV